MKKILLIALALLFSFQVKAQDSKISIEVKEHIQSRVDNQINVGIAVGYVNGESVEFFNDGKTAIENGTNINEETVFEIGSISKTFTGTLLALKVNSGEMSLDDPASKYLPKTVKMPTRNGKEITLKHLATHTSALPRMPDNFSPSNPNNPFVDYTLEQLYAFLSSYELTYEIGKKSEYSNLGMGLLGHILELQSRKSYQELVIEYIANPLQMNDTRLVFTDAMKKRLAKGHAGLSETDNWDIISLGGAGGIRSTASDMVKYIKANLNSDNIDSKLHNAMSLAHETAYKNVEQRSESGLAWDIQDGKILLHNGATGGYTAMIAVYKAEKRGVIVLSNNNENIDPVGIKIMIPSYPLQSILPSIAPLLAKMIEEQGINKALVFYKKIKTEKPNAYNFNEGELNTLGYQYLGDGKKNIALEIFKLNVAEHPEASNPYDSLGEAYLENGNQELAIKNYKKSLELNPANDNARKVLKELNVAVNEEVLVVPQDILNTYAGKYELAPSFIVEISTKEGRLFAQATGQPQFEIFPLDNTNFYFKVVEAKVEFSANQNGEIESMTLFQNGQVILGKRVE